jgi:hypothetical protein
MAAATPKAGVVRRGGPWPLAAIVAAVLAVFWWPSQVMAVSPDSGPTFQQVFRASSIVAVVLVLAASSDGSATLATERVLKGNPASVRTYPADDKAVPLLAGSRLVLIQGGETLDFRGTYALPVAPDGTIDVQGLAGAPRTLAELEAFAALPETATAGFEKMPAVPSPGGQLIAVGTALLLIAGGWLRRIETHRRPR